MKSGHQVETCVVLENTRDAVFLLDLNERIQFVSRSVQFLLGYSPNELLGTRDGRQLEVPVNDKQNSRSNDN